MHPYDEAHLRFLQARYDRLNSDWAFEELSKFCRLLERRYGRKA